MKNLLFILTLSLFVANSQGQSFPPDSAWQAVSKMPNDSTKVQALRNLGSQYDELEKEKALAIYTQALELSKTIGNKACESSCLMSIGIVYITHGSYDTARLYYRQALTKGLQSNNAPVIGKCYGNLANTFMYQNDYDSCIHYNLKAIPYIEKGGTLKTLSQINGNVGQLFVRQHHFDKARPYFQKVLEYAYLSKDPVDMGAAHTYMTNLYTVQAGSKPDSLLYHALKAVEYLKKANSIDYLKTAYHNLSVTYETMGNLKQARLYSDSTLIFARKLDNPHNLGQALIQSSIIYLAEKNVAKAEKLALEAKPYVEKENSWDLWREWYLQMAEIRTKQGRYKEAIDYQDSYYIYKDSIQNDEIRETTSQLEIKYQSEKKQAQITQLENEKQIQDLNLRQRNYWIFALLGALIGVGLIGYLTYRNTKRKEIIAQQEAAISQSRIKELEQERQLLAINSILQGQETERSRVAKDLHDGLGGMLSGIKLNLATLTGTVITPEKDVQLFRHSITQLDSAISELRRVAHNMMPEALLKFGLNEAIQDYCDGINESKTVKMKFIALGSDYKLPQSTEVILYRIVQELSNNALKHADAKNLVVQLDKHQQGMTLTVEDDGKGFNPADLARTQGAGLNNVQSRIDYLNGSWEIKSEPGVGTSCNIEIPYRYDQ